VTDRQTDGQTDGQTDRQTEFSSLYRVCITCSAVKNEELQSEKKQLTENVMFCCKKK